MKALVAVNTFKPLFDSIIGSHFGNAVSKDVDGGLVLSAPLEFDPDRLQRVAAAARGIPLGSVPVDSLTLSDGMVMALVKDSDAMSTLLKRVKDSIKPACAPHRVPLLMRGPWCVPLLRMRDPSVYRDVKKRFDDFGPLSPFRLTYLKLAEVPEHAEAA